MRIIERNVKGTEFAVWIDKQEKQLLDAFAKMRETYKNDETLLLIQPDALFGYDTETGEAVTLEFRRLKND